MTQPLTDRQARVLGFISDYIAKHGYPPAQREIMRRFRIKSTRGVDRHLSALEKKGYLARNRGARAMALHGLCHSRRIPVVGRVAAGRPILAVENIEGTLAIDPKIVPWDGAFFLKVRGDSMTGAGIMDRDFVLVRPQTQAEKGEIVVAILEGEATVKRFMRKGNRIELHAENPAYPPIVVTGENGEFRIVGKVVALFRSMT
jgi:repressor LexA